MTSLPIIQSLWVGSALSLLEILSIQSFLKNGHEFHLYVYDYVGPVPKGVHIKDASEVIPRSGIFYYPSGEGVSAFANEFRLKLLATKGGYWCDLDIVALKPFDFASDYVFSSEYYHANKSIRFHNGIIKAPAGSEYIHRCLAAAQALDKSTLLHGHNGAKIMAEQLGSLSRYVKLPQVFCPVNYYDIEALVRVPAFKVPSSSYAVHLWNGYFTKAYDKRKLYDRECLLGELQRKYLTL